MSASRAIVVGPVASEVRRHLGPTAWCALEVLAASTVVRHGDDGRSVEASVRSVAVELGVSKNAAHRALLVLRQSGLIVGVQHRGVAGQFDVGTYVVAVSAAIVQTLPTANGRHRAAPVESVAFSTAVPARRSSRPRQVEQLVLLPRE